jgi:phage gp16-like protein
VVSRENGKTPFSQVTDARRHGDHLRFPERFGNFAMSITPHVAKSAGARVVSTVCENFRAKWRNSGQHNANPKRLNTQRQQRCAMQRKTAQNSLVELESVALSRAAATAKLGNM